MIFDTRSSIAALALASSVLLVSSASAQTQQVCFTGTIPLTTTNWTNSVSVSKFDPNLGQLQTIAFTLAGRAAGSAAAESTDSAPSTVILQYAATLTLTRPDNSVIVVTIPQTTFNDTFTAFDGVIDFGGSSGITHPGINVTASQSATSPPPASDLALFTGPSGAPGLISLPVVAVGSSTATGSGNLISQFQTQAGADVTVCYTYLPNNPPTINCPAPLNASVGVPISFQVCASDTDAGDLVTLNATGLPAGAVANPPLPVTGNPACTTITWTPTNADVGNTTITFTANDVAGLSVSCPVNITVAECFMVFGQYSGYSQADLFGHLYDTQLAAVRSFYPVTMTENPSFAYRSLPNAFFVQVLMYNPNVFPNNPSQWTPAAQVVKTPNGGLTVTPTGTFNGMQVSATTFTGPNGEVRVRFPFTIEGM